MRPPGGDVALGLAAWAADLGRDLQRAARVAGGAAALWRLGPASLAAVLGVDAATANRLAAMRERFTPAAERSLLAGRGIAFLPGRGGALPARLRDLPDPPFGLFVRGDAGALIAAEERPVVAVVGSRTATGAGLDLARRLGRDLAARGAVVVSGLARGVDAAAHEGTLDAGGTGVAVLGTGVDVPYPRRNEGLADRLTAGGGAVVSEHAPGTPPAPWRFPARNRIVAGLADAVVVVEAAHRSGALITADFALEAGRPVLAVPGWPAAARSAGCNALIRAGAALCEGADDVVAELPGRAWREPPCDAPLPGGLAGDVYEVLRREPVRADQVAATLGVTPGQVGAALAVLEVEGLAVRGEGQRYWAAPRRGAA